MNRRAFLGTAALPALYPLRGHDQGQNNYQDGFRSPPVNWTINTENKRQFFELVKKVTGAY